MTDPNTRTASPEMQRLLQTARAALLGKRFDKAEMALDSLQDVFDRAALASPPSTAETPAVVRGFAPEDFRETATLLRRNESTRTAVASNRHNIILAALDHLAGQAADAPFPAPDAQNLGEIYDEGLHYEAMFVHGGIIAHLETGTPVEERDLRSWKEHLDGPMTALFDKGQGISPAPDAAPVDPVAGDLDRLTTDELIDSLTDGEGDGVTFFSDNPDFNGLPNCCITVNAFWTDWQERTFRADTRRQCLLDAVKALRDGSDPPSPDASRSRQEGE